VRVLFDGLAAPVTYASANQVSAAAPYALSTATATYVSVEYNGVASDPVHMPVASSAPGLFTASGSGSGQAFAENYDSAANGLAAPAPAGSLITVHLSGAGQTNPPAVDTYIPGPGEPRPTPLLPVAVTVSGIPADQITAGLSSMPQLLGMDVKFRIPPTMATNMSAPVVVGVGDPHTQDGVTIAVQNNCAYQLSETSRSFGQTGGSASVDITTGPSCAWTVTGAPAWLTLDVSSGVGNGQVNYTAAASSTHAERSATLTIGGQTLTITQSGQPADVPANPSPADGATGVGRVPTLTWTPATGATSYDVYFGAASTPPLVGNVTAASYTPGVLAPATKYYWKVIAKSSSGTATAGVWSFTTITLPPASAPLGFVAIAPCRIADTRDPAGPLGGPVVSGRRDVPVLSSACGIPAAARAYSLNVTVVPRATLGYLTIWPAGQPQPLASTLNALDGRIKANAAIVPAGAGGAVSVYVTDPTDVILDINGYFVPADTPGSLAFYPVTPCRVNDTREVGGVIASANSRSIAVAGTCQIPGAASAYSLNFTAVPRGLLGYITAWPAGQPQPLASTLNALTGAITANAAIVPAGTGGAVKVYATHNTDVIVDVNGYFAPPGGSGALWFYAAAPCRVLDTRDPADALGGPAMNGRRDFPVTSRLRHTGGSGGLFAECDGLTAHDAGVSDAVAVGRRHAVGLDAERN
jgi:uncharacterized protein (TIGR03437 family)